MSSKKGLGYVKKSIAQSRIENKRRIDFKPTITKENSKRTNLKTIKIWIPKINNSLIRKRYINSFIKSVHKNINYIYKGNTEPSWVWFPKI